MDFTRACKTQNLIGTYLSHSINSLYKRESLSQNVTNAPDCIYDTGLVTQRVKKCVILNLFLRGVHLKIATVFYSN